MKSHWFVSSVPWIGCPLPFNLVVMNKTKEEAVKIFKDFFANQDLEPNVIIPVSVLDETEPVQREN